MENERMIVPGSQGSIWFERAKLNQFIMAYEQTPGNDLAVFMFDGMEFIKGYAKYLIEYVGSRLGSSGVN